MVNLAAGALALVSGYVLIHRMGLFGAGLSKIVAGIMFLPVFGVVRRALKEDEPKGHGFEAPTTTALISRSSSHGRSVSA